MGTVANTIISNANSSNSLVKVTSLYISNIDGTQTASADIDVYRGNVAYRIARQVSVPPQAALDIINKTIYLEEGDSLRLTANANNRLEAVSSYEIIS